MQTKELTPWNRFTNLISLERKDIAQIFYYAIFSGIVALSLPLGIQAIVNLIQGAEISTSWIILVVLVTLGVVFNGLLQLMQLRIIENIQQRIFTRASFEMSYRFPKITLETLRNYYPPELTNRFFDTLTLQKGFSKILIEVPTALLQILLALLVLAFYHPFFIIFGIVILLISYFIFKYSGKKGLETSLEESKYKYKVAHWIQEIARSLPSFKLSGDTQLALEKNDYLVGQYLDSREKHFKIIRLQYNKMIAFKAIITAGLLVIGGILVLNQEMNIGQFVAAEIIIILVINSIEKLILGLETLYDMLTSLEKLGLVFDLPMEQQEGAQPDLSEGIQLEMQHISYQLLPEEEPILKDINFKLDDNNKKLIFGNTNSGKSTFVKLLSKQLSPSSGNFFINGLAAKSVYSNYYRTYVGLVSSEETPFEGTLRENLTFGRPSITDREIYEVMKVVGLNDFLKNQPKGLDTELLPEGKKLSSSISKKIILARAILKNPKLLIIENISTIFSNEDREEIMNYLLHKDKDWSIVFIENNDSLQSYMDEVYELKNGSLH